MNFRSSSSILPSKSSLPVCRILPAVATPLSLTHFQGTKWIPAQYRFFFLSMDPLSMNPSNASLFLIIISQNLKHIWSKTSGHIWQDLSTTSYQVRHSHHTLLRTREANRIQGTKDPLNKQKMDNITCNYTNSSRMVKFCNHFNVKIRNSQDNNMSPLEPSNLRTWSPKKYEIADTRWTP